MLLDLEPHRQVQKEKVRLSTTPAHPCDPSNRGATVRGVDHRDVTENCDVIEQKKGVSDRG